MRAKPLACPICGSRVSRVIDCRDMPYAVARLLTWSGYWRRRRCDHGHTFDTREYVLAPPKNSSSTQYVVRR